MKKLTLAALVIAFAAACSHKSTAPDAKPADATATAAATKDQATPEKKKRKHHKDKVAADQAASPGAVKCSHGEDQRIIEVKAKDEGCETIYTKMGEAKAIATSGKGQEHCKEVAAKIQEHLSGAGFTCQ